MNYQLAQINIARMLGDTIDDPIMLEFKENVDAMNALAEESDGFVWRLKDEEGDATSFNPYNDEQIIVNMSVWEDISSLQEYAFKSAHSTFLKRRKEWFQKFGKPYSALWWVEAGTTPTLEEGVERLKHLQEHGPSPTAFTFRKAFEPEI